MLAPGTADSATRDWNRPSPLAKHQGALNIVQYNQILNNIVGDNIITQQISTAQTSTRRNQKSQLVTERDKRMSEIG